MTIIILLTTTIHLWCYKSPMAAVQCGRQKPQHDMLHLHLLLLLLLAAAAAADLNLLEVI